MKLPSALLATLLVASHVSAQYFSEGWKPGQAVTKTASGTGYVYKAATSVAGAAETPTTEAEQRSPFDITYYLESGPLKALFSRAGVNISERLDAARQEQKIWDERIPFITDENYKEMIVEEKFKDSQEARDRVWFLVITISSAQHEGISRLVDGRFDGAFDLTQKAGDLPNVRWGRIDYMNVTTITTKWGVWRAPYLVVLQDKGQTLRFYRPHQISLVEENLRGFLRQAAYEQSLPWSSAFAPGGPREFVLDYLAVVLTKSYSFMLFFPRWMFILFSGTLASMLINLLHTRGSKKQKQAQKAAAEATTKPEVANVKKTPEPSPPAPAKSRAPSTPPRQTRQRKGKK